MGTVNSTERLAVPLLAQSPPVLATCHGIVAPHTVSLCLPPTTLWASKQRIMDAHTQQHIFDLNFSLLSRWHRLLTPDGTKLMSMQSKTFARVFTHRVYEDEALNVASSGIHVVGFARLVVYANFRDQNSGRKCRLLLAGNPHDQVAVVYLEYGTPDLPTRPRRADATNGARFQAVGRIQRQGDRTSADLIEIASGVDMTLMLLLCRVWRRFEHHRTQPARRAAASVDTLING